MWSSLLKRGAPEKKRVNLFRRTSPTPCENCTLFRYGNIPSWQISSASGRLESNHTMGDRITPGYQATYHTASKPLATTLENSPLYMSHENVTRTFLCACQAGWGKNGEDSEVESQPPRLEAGESLYNATPSARYRANRTIASVSNAQAEKRQNVETNAKGQCT